MAFGVYARYYDLLYKDKDNRSEIDFIIKLLQRYSKGVKSILDLGCGTGRHDFLLSDAGYNVTGIDMSEEMLASAHESQKKRIGSKISVEFLQGDIRTVKLDKLFDAVFSLFHVMSYQTSNDDLLAAFRTAKRHISNKGIFIFDCWYGPAVLTTKPEVRIKRMEDSSIQVTRIAEPVIHPNSNLVDVNYTILIKDKKTLALEELHEMHRMRYLFLPEIELLLSSVGFTLIGSCGWMEEKEPGVDTWGAVFIAVNKEIK